MRCTNCSTVLKPVVAIDIDGTLGDYHSHFLHFAEDYLNEFRHGWTYTGKQGFKAWFCEEYRVDNRTWGDIKLAYRQGAQKRSMPAYSGARHLTDNVREMGAELWLTTTRPHLRLDNVDPDTRAWLDRQGITFDYMLYDEEKYAVLADRVDAKRVVAVLDDLPEQYAAAARTFGGEVAILRGTKYNRDARAETRVLNLPEAEAAITTRIANWRAGHR